jgi:hypothetical protein
VLQVVIILLGLTVLLNLNIKCNDSKSRVDKIRLSIRTKIDSHSFSAFADDPKTQEILLKGTYLKWEHTKGPHKGIGYSSPFDDHSLLKKEHVRNIIREYVFDDWELRINLECTDDKAYIQPNTIRGQNKIEDVPLISTELDNGIYYYNIQVEYVFDINDTTFNSLEGFDGATCEVSLSVPEVRAIQPEFMILELLGPNKKFLQEAHFKAHISRPIAFKRHVILGEIKIPETYSREYKKPNVAT